MGRAWRKSLGVGLGKGLGSVPPWKETRGSAEFLEGVLGESFKAVNIHMKRKGQIMGLTETLSPLGFAPPALRLP